MCTSWRDLRKMHQSNSRLSSPTHIYVHCVQSASPKVNCKKQVYFWGSAEITPLKFGHNQICSIPRLKDCKLQDWNVHPCLQNSRQIFGSFFISLLKASRWLKYCWWILEITSNDLKSTFASWFWHVRISTNESQAHCRAARPARNRLSRAINWQQGQYTVSRSLLAAPVSGRRELPREPYYLLLLFYCTLVTWPQISRRESVVASSYLHLNEGM